MKLGKLGIGRKPDMSIDSTRNFRVLGQQIKKLWAKSCFKSEHENWRWKNDWFCRVSEIGLLCENACTYRFGLFRVYKWHYGLPPKPKNLPQEYTWTRVTAVFSKKFTNNVWKFWLIFANIFVKNACNACNCQKYWKAGPACWLISVWCNVMHIKWLKSHHFSVKVWIFY